MQYVTLLKYMYMSKCNNLIGSTNNLAVTTPVPVLVYRCGLPSKNIAVVDIPSTASSMMTFFNAI